MYIIIPNFDFLWMDGNMKRPMAWLAVVVAVAIGGCCGRQVSQNTTNRIFAQGVDKQAVMDATQKVLEEMHFIIEKCDASAGYISTRPLPAAQFFEVWRSDTVGCANFAEANLHSVTRTAEINITAQDDAFCIECRVDTRRLSMPNIDVRGRRLQAPELKKEQKKAAVWMDLGPDTELQARILDRIGKQIGRVGL